MTFIRTQQPMETVASAADQKSSTGLNGRNVGVAKVAFDEPEDQSPIEEVALTVATTDDPETPVWTFRMWTLGVLSCSILAFLNQFFAYRTEPLTISAVSAQIAALPLGRLMAAFLPSRKWLKGSRFEFSLNPGPFNMKEHVLITIFASAGSGGAYAIGIMTIVKAFYRKRMTYFVALAITITTQVNGDQCSPVRQMIGYGWAGLFRNFLVKPSQLWWPANLVQVSLFRTLHEKDHRPKGGLTRTQFFLLILVVSFAWYALPGYLFPLLSSFSWVCWAWPSNITAQQLGSGMQGLGIGAIGFDWATASAFLESPLATPFFAIFNIYVGFALVMYIITPIIYYADVYSAKTFPIFSARLFDSSGKTYNISRVMNDHFSLDAGAYEEYSKLNLSAFFVLTYGMGFAALTATLSHVILFHGRDILLPFLSAEKEDVHNRLMKAYPEVPQWWFQSVLAVFLALSIAACKLFNDELQLPWWGVILACAISYSWTLPIGVIAATTNQVPGLNIVAEYMGGYLYPGKPVANVVFKTYSHISVAKAVTFLADFKLGVYMKIPPRSMFAVQLCGTILATLINVSTAWWLLTSIVNICQKDLLPPDSPWTCPADRVFFDQSVIWGLIGPRRTFGSQGLYEAMNWFFLFGAVAPVPVWLASRKWPKKKWISSINMPILIGATRMMPLASSVNYTTWFLVGFIFEHLFFKYRKGWWQRYNYLMSGGLDAGLAFMGVALYFTLGMQQNSIAWWGSTLDHCPLATCPTAPGVQISGC